MPKEFAIDEIYAFSNPGKYLLQNSESLYMLLRPAIYTSEVSFANSISLGALNAIESGVPATENS